MEAAGIEPTYEDHEPPDSPAVSASIFYFKLLYFNGDYSIFYAYKTTIFLILIKLISL